MEGSKIFHSSPWITLGFFIPDSFSTADLTAFLDCLPQVSVLAVLTRIPPTTSRRRGMGSAIRNPTIFLSPRDTDKQAHPIRFSVWPLAAFTSFPQIEDGDWNRRSGLRRHACQPITTCRKPWLLAFSSSPRRRSPQRPSDVARTDNAGGVEVARAPTAPRQRGITTHISAGWPELWATQHAWPLCPNLFRPSWTERSARIYGSFTESLRKKGIGPGVSPAFWACFSQTLAGLRARRLIRPLSQSVPFLPSCHFSRSTVEHRRRDWPMDPPWQPLRELSSGVPGLRHRTAGTRSPLSSRATELLGLLGAASAPRVFQASTAASEVG